MTGLQAATLAGMLVALGLVFAVRASRPAPPSLSAALEQLSASPTVQAAPTPASTPLTPAASQWDWLPPSLARTVDEHLGVSEADLNIIGRTRTQLAARKLTLSLTGLLAPALFGLVLALLDVPLPFVLPGVLSVALAAVGWLLPSAEAREAARHARAEFRSNLESFLTLVAGERRARGSVEQALEEAAEVSGSVPFVRMHRAIRRAALSGRKPWTDLRDLGDDIDVAELRSLADIAAVAADGASVYNTLLASARTLRHTELSDARSQANEISERMSRPLALLVTGLTFFVLVPFLLRMFAVTS
ncbi:Type II secretion system (T2SS), protein F [Modestobacter sp. DSM 44400]|uniref:type II secretion system F family protein n=1 Tax=Modestobacter sp. DSM 44400 TaxID=1550230 RepID=UPI000895ED65|nr:type II secretion system F family protein [Modestobacter sp. DSM 44400]SDY73563.1 Type II secretion system (T2SS), protein F [Modestobacter sp. DSM 44400]